MTPTTTICALLIILYGIRLLRRRVFSVLDSVPGLPRQSFIRLGNLTEFNDPDGWEFQQELQESYGQVVKVHGLFGRRELFVFDPAALHSILVQDQDIYEPPETCSGM
ncbi:hypothetical protein B0H14DRAFT_2536023 [Mycena olivaceomarginata]|nr:hypothetical protein B0H14DRAFT_2536023 [Mycena olivaceomarginata]